MQNTLSPIIKKGLNVIYLFISIELLLKIINNYSSINKLIIPSAYVNYNYGFIRRGLLGTFLYYFSLLFNLNPFYLQILLYLILCGLLLFFMTKGLLNKNQMPYILLASFTFLNIMGYEMFFMNDVMIILHLILHLYILEKIKNYDLKIIFATLSICIGILNHEAFFLFSILPTLLLLSNNFSKISLKVIIISVFLLLLFLTMPTLFNGNNIDENDIINSWDIFGTSYKERIKLLYWLYNYTDEVIIWKISIFQQKPYYLLAFLINFFVIYFTFLMFLFSFFKYQNRTFIAIVSFLQFLVVLALSTIAVDYVRWYFLATISTFITIRMIKDAKFHINIDNRFNFFEKYIIYYPIIILFVGLPMGGSWSPTEYIYTMPITYLVDLILRIT